MIDVPSEVISCNLQQLLGIWRNRDIFLRSPNILSRTAEHFSRTAEHFSVAFDVIWAVQVNPLLNDFCGEALFGARPQVFSQIKQLLLMASLSEYFICTAESHPYSKGNREFALSIIRGSKKSNIGNRGDELRGAQVIRSYSMLQLLSHPHPLPGWLAATQATSPLF